MNQHSKTILCIVACSAFAAAVCLMPLRLAADETASASEHPLKPAIRFATSSLEKVEALAGYEATFFKQEVVGNSTVKHKIKAKIRHEPFSVYLYFDSPHEGREVLYVEGQNGGKLLAHEGGLLSVVGTMELMPGDSTAMNENRHPVTRAGIANLVKAVIQQWEEESKYQESDVKYFKDAKLGTMTCRVIECTHPVPRKQFVFHRTRLWIDDASGLPVRVQQFGFPATSGSTPPVIEDYSFTDLKTNIRLTDADFDKSNPRYGFR